MDDNPLGNSLSPEPNGSQWQSLFGGGQTVQSQDVTQSHDEAQPHPDAQSHKDVEAPNLADVVMLSREASPTSSNHSSVAEDDVYIIDKKDPIKEFGLRTRIDRHPRAALQIDADTTDGNFDPTAEAREAAQRRNKAKLKKKAQGGNRKQGKVEKRKKGKKDKVPKLILRLHIRRFGTVLNITNMEQNWPDGHSEVDTDDDSPYTYVPRVSYNEDPQIRIEDPRGEYEDLTGHPEARGCIPCRKADQPCSTVQNGNWPCEACMDNHDDCEKINESEHKRIDLDEELYGPQRKQVQCDACVVGKKKCSLKEKSDRPPCKQCKKKKLGCTFYGPAVLEESKSKKKQETVKTARQSYCPKTNVYIPDRNLFTASDLEESDNSISDTDSIREPTPEIIMEDQLGNRGPVIEIRTCFAHPIEFHIYDDADEARLAASRCSFCTCPIFNFVGHYETMVYVLVWPNGKGYTEFGNGHKQQDRSSTVMCVDCSHSRLQIIACEKHQIQPIQGRDSSHQELESALQDLLDSAEESRERYSIELQGWCSFCINLATHRCCVAQESALRENVQLDGCGLSLCGACEQVLREEFAGNTDAMATAYDKKPKAKSDSNEDSSGTVRADVGFLREEGQLWRSTDIN